MTTYRVETVVMVILKEENLVNCHQKQNLIASHHSAFADLHNCSWDLYDRFAGDDWAVPLHP